MHTLALAIFFQLWAGPCASVTMLPTVTVREYPFELRVHNATTGVTLLQVIEGRYMPHNSIMGYTYIGDGERVWDVPVELETLEDGTLPSLPIRPASCRVEVLRATTDPT